MPVAAATRVRHHRATSLPSGVSADPDALRSSRVRPSWRSSLRTRWLPDGMVFADATEAGAEMGNDVPEAEEGYVHAADALAEAESDEPSSLPAFLSGDAA